MVKFSKELEAQLIPEWKEAFVNYWQLKKHIKRVKLSRLPSQSPHHHRPSLLHPLGFFSQKPPQPDIIQVRRKIMDGTDDEVYYETELAQLFSEEDEVRLFFERLDEELNKVNQFYKRQEKEFLERGEMLHRQLQILVDLKHLLSPDRHRKIPPPSKPSDAASFHHFLARHPDYSEDESKLEALQTNEMKATLEKNGVSFVNSATKAKTKKGKSKMAMRIDIPGAAGPARAITAATSVLWEDLVNNPMTGGCVDINQKRRIQYAEKMIRGAFVELYRALGLLKTYSSLNMVAFSKILKKFDKVSCQKTSENYLAEVKRSHFISSDKVVRLMDEVESIFTKHFADSDRKKAMKFLRPQQQHKDSHTVTFFVGLFTGCFVSLFCVYVILAHLSGVFSPTSEAAYVDAIYPIFSVFALLSLHLFMYGCNLFMWKSTRINYNFIFEFQPNTALKHRDAFLISATFMTAVVGAMIIHLLLKAAGFSPGQVDDIPGILLLLSIGLLICPLDIFYRSTRYCFLRVLRNIVFSPLYKVLLVDFFMADQLTSQIPLLRSLETAGCNFVGRVFKTYPPETCSSGKLYVEITYIISFLPYYWRAMQCARRWYDDNKIDHLTNMGKYVSAMVAAGARVTYGRKEDHLWFAIVLVTSAVATVYQLYWDFVKDWGFLNPNSKNRWLRDDLILKNKSIYYLSMALNVVLRVAWVEGVLHLKVGPARSRLLEFWLASLEVIRRGHWNFYRLENEHLNNVGNFRAVKAVPLPFRETEYDN
ncbi:phosphate transporter PHO1-like [Neltuma alba]|uniref:phosphate transporter PHO1-like n=1 Tax=Neltuma alba TaxID=207710 RepID=UPI0010A2C220|nr:phosphate transporter PHO1-like [Prosopis alba]